MKIGIAFGDHVKTEKIKRWHYKERRFSMRPFMLLLIIGFFSLILLARLLTIQVVKGNYYRTLSDSNRIRTTIIHAPRGIILDRNGVPLVYNLPGFREVLNKKTVLLNRDEAVDKIAHGEKGIEIDSLREYPFKDVLSHVVGYVGQVSPDQLKNTDTAYDPTDLIGKAGIEESYESTLRGTNGKQLIEVDAMGKPVRTLGQTDPIAGHDISLTIDASFQQKVYQAMRGVSKGAAIVSTPQGQILAMVSKPSFDPNLFTLDKSYQAASGSGYTKVSQILLDGTGQPLLNRAISGAYPPGSTFKIVTAASGLEEKVINKDYTIDDEGIIHIGPYSFTNWYFTQYGKKEGPVNVVRAISRSNDIFFYKLAQMLSVDRLSETAAEFGIGKQLGIDLAGEATGVLPTKVWKEKNVGEQWYLGDTFIYGIGQGYLLTTPLQVNAWTAAIANGGSLYKPHLLKTDDTILNKNFLHPENVALIREGMVQACSTGGTAYPLFNYMVKNPHLSIDNKNYFPVTPATGSALPKDSADYRHVSVACKTGTAQHGDENTEPHAWMTLFAPAEDPQIVVTVLDESSGEGSTVAGPIAREILDAWFSRQ